MVSEVSKLETSAWQQQVPLRVRLQESNAIWLVTVECGKSCDTISSVKLFGLRLFFFLYIVSTATFAILLSIHALISFVLAKE